METLTAKVTSRLVEELDEMIADGWYGNRSEAIRDAIRGLIERRRYLEARRAVHEEIEWGLYGK